MTEAEWLMGTDPKPMLEFLRGSASDRKSRLLGCACCRRVWHALPNDQSREAVEIAERLADGRGVTSRRQRAAANAAWDAAGGQVSSAVVLGNTGFLGAFHGLHTAVCELLRSRGIPYLLGVSREAVNPEWERAASEEKMEQSRLVRCIFGNPFRDVAVDPSWLTPTVVQLAAGMYDSRDFSAMPILADALQDAGCDNATVLDHCRGAGPHARGCWVVDVFTGRS